MNKLLLTLSFLTISLSLFSKEEINKNYPLPWREPQGQEFISIQQTLIKNNVKGCGEYYIRSSKDDAEYLVGCTRDGRVWTYYIIWTATQKAMGPYTDKSIKKPH